MGVLGYGSEATTIVISAKFTSSFREIAGLAVSLMPPPIECRPRASSSPRMVKGLSEVSGKKVVAARASGAFADISTTRAAPAAPS